MYEELKLARDRQAAPDPMGLEVEPEVAESGRAARPSGAAGANFFEVRYGAISAKMQTAGTLPGNLPVPCRYPVHFAGA